ncbi:hypothetical protein RUM44_008857 [Polyplax serrata]|uniref:Uncharacterized protein n=1 Tax=Polyplax serrata TaxID=468196 RepID=A0ABR1BEE7_POLSC
MWDPKQQQKRVFNRPNRWGCGGLIQVSEIITSKKAAVGVLWGCDIYYCKVPEYLRVPVLALLALSS